MPNRNRLHAALSLTLAIATTAFAGDAPAEPGGALASDSDRIESSPDWVPMDDRDGIRSYKLQRDDSPLLCFKAEGIIDAPIDLVLSVVLDAERSTEWISHLTESLVIRWVEAPTDFVQLSRFDIPWPVKDRVFVSRVVVEVDPETYEAVLAYEPSDDEPEPGNAIVGSAVGTRFRFRPIDGGARTSLTGIGVADPKGALPAWLVNWVGRSWPHQSIQALRTQVLKKDVAVLPEIGVLYAGFEVEPRLKMISADPAPPR